MSTEKQRGLSEAFLKDLEDGPLKWVTTRAQEDHTVCLEIRHEYVDVYYRGGRLLHIESIRAKAGKYKFTFDKKYFDDDTRIDLPSATDPTAWKECILALKNAIDLNLGRGAKKSEREFQQLVVRENNFSPIAKSTDYYICDQEYRIGQTDDSAPNGARLDLVGVRWPSHRGDRKKQENLRLALMEMKYGDDSIAGDAGLTEHLADMAAFIDKQDAVEKIKQEMRTLFKQKRRLGLICCKKDVESFSDKPEVLFLLANHDPAKEELSKQIKSPAFQETVENLEARGVSVRFVRSSYSGYGLFEDQFLGLHSFKRAVDEDWKKAQRSRPESSR